MTLIKTYEELDDWLKKYHCFEDGHVLEIDMNTLAITVGLTISGTYRANTEQETLNFEITPTKVSSYSCAPNFVTGNDHCIDSIEPVEVDEGVGLQITDPRIILIAESFTISEGKTIKSIVKPHISRRDIYMRAPMEEIPKPDFWQQEFKKLGYDIAFRYYAGESKPLQKLPSNYVGYFFQLENRVNTTKHGIFIAGCARGDKGISMSFEQDDEELDSLWTALTIILARIPDVTIYCGNCKFTGPEWLQKCKFAKRFLGFYSEELEARWR